MLAQLREVEMKVFLYSHLIVEEKPPTGFYASPPYNAGWMEGFILTITPTYFTNLSYILFNEFSLESNS